VEKQGLPDSLSIRKPDRQGGPLTQPALAYARASDSPADPNTRANESQTLGSAEQVLRSSETDRGHLVRLSAQRETSLKIRSASLERASPAGGQDVRDPVFCLMLAKPDLNQSFLKSVPPNPAEH
jgi:hypothetical protein